MLENTRGRSKEQPERPPGQALVEVALILPFILLISLAVIEFSRLLAIYSLTSGAARQATRKASVAMRAILFSLILSGLSLTR